MIDALFVIMSTDKDLYSERVLVEQYIDVIYRLEGEMGKRG